MRRLLSSAASIPLYGGPPAAAAAAAPAVTLAHLDALRAQRRPIAVITAHDAPLAASARAAGVDVVLVGDSLGMVALGYASTLPVSLAAMAHHCAAVARGAQQAGAAAGEALPPLPLLVGDLPFGSYATVDAAVTSAAALCQGGGMAMVKLEGGRAQAGKVRACVEEGMPVMGHVGLLPQTALLGGGRYALAGRSAGQALGVVEDALALQAAGARALVLEMLPWQLADYITRLLRVPTIGIGAGPACSGQVLVSSDALGVTPRTPFFVKRYAELGRAARGALAAYAQEVRSGAFPGGAGAGHARGMEPAEVAQLHALAARHFPEDREALAALEDSAARTEAGAVGAGAAAAGGGFTSFPAPSATPAVRAPPAPRPPAPAPAPALLPPPSPLRIAILGSGAIGSLLACTLAASGYTLTMYSHWSERVRHINARGISWLDCAPQQQQQQQQREGSQGLRALHTPPLSAIRAVDLAQRATAAADSGSYDLVFIAGSAVDADVAFPLAWELVSARSGMVLPLYNGHFALEYGAGLAAGAQRAGWQLGAGLTSAGATLPAPCALLERTGLSSSAVSLFLPGLQGGGERGQEAGRAVQALVAHVARAAAQQAGSGAPAIPLTLALHAPQHWAAHRLTKLLVNSVLNPVLALSAQQCGPPRGGGGGGIVNGEFSRLVAGAFDAPVQGGGRKGPLAEAAQGLCEEAAQCLASIPGAAAVPGWEGVASPQALLALVAGVGRATAGNVNSMVADARGGRVSEVDFINGALVAHLRKPTWNNRMLAAVSARERALGVRSSAREARIKGVWGSALEALGGSIFPGAG